MGGLWDLGYVLDVVWVGCGVSCMLRTCRGWVVGSRPARWRPAVPWGAVCWGGLTGSLSGLPGLLGGAGAPSRGGAGPDLSGGASLGLLGVSASLLPLRCALKQGLCEPAQARPGRTGDFGGCQLTLYLR